MSATESLPVLIVHLAAKSGEPGDRLRRALAQLDCLRVSDRRYEGVAMLDPDPKVLELAAACAEEGASAIVFAPLGPAASADGEYQRLYDRTDEFAEALAAWKSGRGLLPLLKPGELLRL